MREFFALVEGHVVSIEVVEMSSSVLQRLTIFSVGFKAGKSFFWAIRGLTKLCGWFQCSGWCCTTICRALAHRLLTNMFWILGTLLIDLGEFSSNLVHSAILSYFHPLWHLQRLYARVEWMLFPWKPFFSTCSHLGQVFVSFISKETVMEGSFVSWICIGDCSFSLAATEEKPISSMILLGTCYQICMPTTSLGGASSGIYFPYISSIRSTCGKMASSISEYLQNKAQLCGEDVELAQSWMQMDELYAKKWVCMESKSSLCIHLPTQGSGIS